MNPPDIPFDAIGNFVILLIGLPALVVQMMPDEIRRAVMKNQKDLLVATGLPLGVALAIIAFCIVTYSIIVGIEPNTTSESFLRIQWLWTRMFTGLMVVAVSAAIYLPYRYGQRDKVVENLVKRASTHLEQDARLVENELQILVELGEQSATGTDKQVVLAELDTLTDRICKHPAYRGDALESVIHSLPGIFMSADEQCHERNLCTAAEILQRIVTTPLIAPNMLTIDLLAAVRAFSTVSQAAMTYLELNSDVEHIVVVNCVQPLALAARQHRTITMEVSQEFFEIGILAIKSEHPLVAQAALGELLTLIESNAPADGELVYDTLGLAAHFSSGGSDAMRAYGWQKVYASRTHLAQDLRIALTRARNHCINTTYFETADHLQQLIEDLDQTPA